jgi:hypothetical protein
VRWADPTSRDVLQSVVVLSVIMEPQQLGGPSPLGAVAPCGGGKSYSKFITNF